MPLDIRISQNCVMKSYEVEGRKRVDLFHRNCFQAILEKPDPAGLSESLLAVWEQSREDKI